METILDYYYYYCYCRFSDVVYVTCRFKTATPILIPLQGLEMVWPFQKGQLFLLAVLIPHQFDIGGQVCSVAFKCNSSNTIKTYRFIRTAFGLL